MGITVARNRLEMWPSATNTGVPAGTSLTPQSGNISTSSNGQIIQELDLDGVITVDHTNVTIRRCKINGSLWCVRINSGGVDCLIEDCELDCQFTDGSVACWQLFGPAADVRTVVRRCNIHDAEDYFRLSGSIDIRDCYGHDNVPASAFVPAPHPDAVSVNEGTFGVTIHHNRFVMNDATSCVNIFNEAGTQCSDFQVTHNKFDGGSFCIYGPRFSGASDIVINHNRLRGWSSGPEDVDLSLISGLAEAIGNVNDDTGAPITF